MRATTTGALAFVTTLVLAAPALAWSPTVHRSVTERTIDILPKDLKRFYEGHWKEMPSLAVDAKVAEDNAERRFAVDRLLPFPFTGLPKSEAAFKERFGDAAAIGRLPWLAQEAYDDLVKAFRAGDKDAILETSDRLSALVADLHNPLAITDNFDGQKTDQHGLWVRFSGRLAERLLVDSRIKLDADTAHLLDDPKGQVFAIIEAAYVWADNIWYEDSLAHRGKTSYMGPYYEDLAERTRELVGRRLGRAVRDSGSFWYTAWVTAGRPALQ